MDSTDPAGAPSFLQSDWWFSIKEAQGWRGYRLAKPVVGDTAGDGELRGRVAPGGLLRRVGPFFLFYLPYACETCSSIHDVTEAMRSLAASAPEPVSVLRWDSPWELRRFSASAARDEGLQRSPMRVQPPDTVILDLAGTEEQLLTGMKAKTRYNVRLATKRNVEVRIVRPDEEGAEEALAAWYRLYQDTARRDRIAIHPGEYYRRVFLRAAAVNPDGLGSAHPEPRREMLLAWHEGDLLGGIVTVSYEGTTTYLYGAGADVKRNLMASYLLQWEAIRRAREGGDRWYDFFGIPPSDDPGHPMHGLYRFKTGFGGRVIHRAGAWDLPIRPLRTRLYHGAERLRKWYYFSFRKRGE